MKLDFLNRKVSWVALLVAALIVIPSVQQYCLIRAHRNERAADDKMMQLGLENSALKLSLEGK